MASPPPFAEPHETYFNALQKDTLVKLTVGQEPAVSFLIPKSTIKHCWGFSSSVQDIERRSSSNTHERKSSSTSTKAGKDKDGKDKDGKDKDGKGKDSKRKENKLISPIKDFLSPNKKKWKEKEKYEELLQSQQSEMPEINRPDDDPVTWAAFLYWSSRPDGVLPQAVLYRDYKLVRCWNFAWEYGFYDFADDVMIALIAGLQGIENDKTHVLSSHAIQEAFCLSDNKETKMKTLIVEEILKGIENGCPVVGTQGHDPRSCRGCKQDLSHIKDLKCRRGKSNPHGEHRSCPLDSQLSLKITLAKRDYAGRRDKFFNRLTNPCQGGAGGAPMYMQFLISDKWEEVKKAFDDPDKRREPNRLTMENFGYREPLLEPSQIGILPDPSAETLRP